MLLTTSPYYNPFILMLDGRSYVISNFVFFDENGIIAKTQYGWFGSNNYIKHIENNIPVVKKVKPDFKAKTAFIIHNKENDWKTDKEYFLYIPVSLCKLELIENKKWLDCQIRSYYKCDLHEDAKFDVCLKVIDRKLSKIRKEINEIGEKINRLYQIRSFEDLPGYTKRLNKLYKDFKKEYQHLQDATIEELLMEE